jgi:hypothetical protein
MIGIEPIILVLETNVLPLNYIHNITSIRLNYPWWDLNPQITVLETVESTNSSTKAREEWNRTITISTQN